MTPSGPPRRRGGGRLAGFQLRLRLFLVSYAPLAGVFAWQCHTCNGQIGWASTAAFLVGLGAYTSYGQLRRGSVRTVITAVEDKSGDVAGYLASYLLPFIAGPPDSVAQGGAYATFFLVLGVIFTRSRTLPLINPTLYLLRWKVVGAEVGSRHVLVLCRDEPSAGETIDLILTGTIGVRKDTTSEGDS